MSSDIESNYDFNIFTIFIHRLNEINQKKQFMLNLNGKGYEKN